jgi:acetyl esterase/lipase
MRKQIVFFFLFGYAIIANAQTEIALYNGSIPNSKPCGTKEFIPLEGRVAGITIPKLFIYKPALQDSFKAAIIICPGGGYARLAIEHEGFKVAEALAQKGITAFVLKYRNPIDSACVVNKELVAMQDAQQAIKLVRDKANEFGIDANNIGMMGFSAGGHVTSTIATHFTTTTIENKEKTNLRPNFIILGYPVISFADSLAHKGSKENMLGKNATKKKVNLYSNELQVAAQTPPTFLLHAADDKSVKVENSVLFYQALLQKKVPAELHIMQAGGHGFGLTNKAEPINWLNNVFAWLMLNKCIKGNVQ